MIVRFLGKRESENNGRLHQHHPRRCITYSMSTSTYIMPPYGNSQLVLFFKIIITLNWHACLCLVFK